MKVLVTGAAGFIGAALVDALAARPDIENIVAFDQMLPVARHAKVEALSGNLAYAPMARSLAGPGIDAIFHLASLVSGGAEQNFELGMKVNFDATRDLLEAARMAADASGRCPKFVFTSSIAVYRGVRDVTDDTRPAPSLSYGAQKLMCEVLINDYSRRGYVDGRTLRLPTVLVRPGAANTALSGWSSAIIREPLAGRAYVCPVRPDTQMACISVARVAESLLHCLDVPVDALGYDRTVLLEGIPVTAQAMLEAVQECAGAPGGAGGPGIVKFEADPAVQSVMDAVARSTHSERAARLGFKPSVSIAEIVTEYIQGRTPSKHP